MITDMIARGAGHKSLPWIRTTIPETYELLAKTQKRYPMPFKVYYPDTTAVENMVMDKGINLL